MSVAEHLGLSSPGTNELIRQAQQRWPDWCRSDPRLAVVTDPLQVSRWTMSAERGRADGVLHALATLAAGGGRTDDDGRSHCPGDDGGDCAGDDGRGGDGRGSEGGDRAAAMTLCWTLLPAAKSLAHQLRGLTPEVDEAVASQLWVEARTFPWRRLRKVAANIRANTRAGVLRQCSDRTRARTDRTWSLTRPVDPTAPFWATLDDPTDVVEEPTASEELLDLLGWACRQDVITSQERALLLSLVQAAEGTVVTRSGRGGGGLMANETSEHVAREWGVSPVTVRRRARRSMSALAEACRHGRYEACA